MGRGVVADIEAAAAFGGEGTGVTRLAWSPELRAVQAWLTEQLEELGLEVELDAAGNLIGRWQAGTGSAIAVGSHLDTVPSGGRYDGALGVLSGLQAIRLLKERGVEPKRPLWLISFMDEEGARFGAALFGSRAFVGKDLGDLGERTDGDGISLREAMAEQGFDFDALPRARGVDGIGAYLELHIEQGPVLESEGLEIGIVTGIVGLIGYRARFVGEANHAGTTPMRLRRDALCGAATAILELRDAALARDDITTNVGIVSAEPGGSNVVPGAAEFSIDVRSATPEGYASLEPLVRDTLGRIASEQGLELELREVYRLEPLAARPRARRRPRAGRGGRGRHAPAPAERRRPRRDGGRPSRPLGNALRAEPQGHQPQPRRVHRARALRARGARSRADTRGPAPVAVSPPAARRR